jgi:hypothetical protein
MGCGEMDNKKECVMVIMVLVEFSMLFYITDCCQSLMAIECFTKMVTSAREKGKIASTFRLCLMLVLV